jgi:hypothetical protein
MNRLTKTYRDKTYKIFRVADDLPCGENSYDFKNLLIQKLGEYEDLEEQGLLIKLPCKVGTDIFRIVNKRIGRGNNRKFNLTIQRGKAQWGDYDKFGKTVFLTREEAEKVLEEQ